MILRSMTLFLALVSVPAAEITTFSNIIDGVKWQSISEIKVDEKWTLTENAELKADRVVIAAPVITSGKGLRIFARELVFEGSGLIRAYEAPRDQTPPQPSKRAKANDGLDCPGDLTEFQYYVAKYPGRERAVDIGEKKRRYMDEKSFEKAAFILVNLGIPYIYYDRGRMSIPYNATRSDLTIFSSIQDMRIGLKEFFSENEIKDFENQAKNLSDRILNTDDKNLNDSDKKLKNESRMWMSNRIGLSPLEQQVLFKYANENILTGDLRVSDLEELRKTISVQKRLVVIETAAERIKGRPGAMGAQGLTGYAGDQNPSEILVAAELVRGALVIDGKGQKGGKGGAGQDGQDGGNGGRGCDADNGWLGTGIDSSDNTPGGQGGRGGNAGVGGRGGPGGAPVAVGLLYDAAVSNNPEDRTAETELEKLWQLVSKMGDGGEPGDGGAKGNGGLGGFPGGTSRAWFSDIGNKDIPRAPSGESGASWNPTAAELESLKGESDPTVSKLRRLKTGADALRAKRKLFDKLLELHLERNRWLLFLKSLDFSFSLKSGLGANHEGKDIASTLKAGRPDQLSTANQAMLKSLAEAWRRQLELIDFEAKKNVEDPALKNAAFDKFQKISKDIAEEFEALSTVLETDAARRRAIFEKLISVINIQEMRLTNFSDQLSELCKEYLAQPLADELAEFRIQFCTDQTWRRNPEAVFEITRPISIVAPKVAAIKTRMTEVDQKSLVPEKFRELFGLMGGRTGGADDPFLGVLGDESFRSLIRAIYGSDTYFKQSSIRADMSIQSLGPLSQASMNSVDKVRASLGVVGLQRWILSKESSQ